MTIRAPFNFVPISDKVYFPDWANKISQDIPFSDGLSGTIELKIEAKTPIFVRNGHKREDRDVTGSDYEQFSKAPDNRYFIPGTSIKGAIRNVMEIMSFGKMGLDKNARFAQREWYNKELYPIKEAQTQQSIRCGWLRRNDEGYIIEDCGKPFRIGHTRIDEHLGDKRLENYFRQDSKRDLNKAIKLNGTEYDPKTAAFKYAIISKKDLCNLRFKKDYQFSNKYKENRVMVSYDGDIEGTIVLTGQPDLWKFPRPQKLEKDAGKFYEFVFPNEVNKRHQLSEQEFNQYKFIYKDSPDWKLALADIDTTGIPVFFRLDDKKHIKDWVLAFMYKLPYEKTPRDILGNDHKDNKLDMCECIFGTEVEGNALKGRVQFGHAFITETSKTDSESIPLSLSSPKASFYPIYIKQQGRNGIVTTYDTYNKGKISGWKRYVVRQGTNPQRTGNDNIDTVITPLTGNPTFVTNISFHNLREAELGLLLSALTMHDTEGCFHQIGQGKPYGFGKVAISITKYPNDLPPAKDLMQKFERGMYDNFLKSSWANSNQIKELITLAKEEVLPNDLRFTYMQLSTQPRINDFVTAKSNKEYLRPYTELINKTHKVESLYDGVRNDILKQKEAQTRQEQEAQQREKEEQEKREAEKRAQKRQNAGLTFLLEKKIDNKGLKIDTLSNGAKRIKEFFKRHPDHDMNERDIDAIRSWLKELPHPTKSADKKELGNRSSVAWRTLDGILKDSSIVDGLYSLCQQA